MDSKVYFGLQRDAIKKVPEFVESTPIIRDYDSSLYQR